MSAPRASSVRTSTAQVEHPLQWLAEPLLSAPTFVLKAWFGGRSIMLHGQHRLFLIARGEPWQGVLICTYREHHESLLREFPFLVKHPVLGKWLYLSEASDAFERDARRLAQLVVRGDPRVGILPSPKKKRAAKKIRFGDKL